MKHVRFLAFFCVFTLLFSSFFVPTASDNDARFDSYVNMGENAVKNGYAIPNLFRQDGVYSNIQKFPLVVKNGVEYVPLSVFILYPHVEVNYSKTSENFFLLNNKNNHYLSFNVEEEVASTYDGDLLRLSVLIFNKTRYVPARTVALILGFSCETYDDPENGIYAFRISDGKSQKTLSELLTPYIESYKKSLEETTEKPPEETTPNEPEKEPPVVKPPKEPIPDESEKEPDETTPPKQPVKPKDPLEDIAERRIAICYSNAAYGDIENVLNVLDWYGIKASFGVTEEDVLLRTKSVRRMFVSGHSLVVTASAVGDTAGECAESFVAGLEKANEALLKTLKRKTRMCTLPFDLSLEIANDKEFVSAVEEAGYIILKPNVDTGDGPEFEGGAYSISSKIKNKIAYGFNENEKATVTALVWCSDKTQYYTADVANFVNKYTQHSFCAMNEALLAGS